MTASVPGDRGRAAQDWRALAARTWPRDRVDGDGAFGLRHRFADVPWPHPDAVTQLFETPEEASRAEVDASLHWLTHPDPHGGACSVAPCVGHDLVTLRLDGEGGTSE
jgi:hypothetical protein